ncbi:universal stress protein PHOS32 isoform X1 [Physcomitrium patens]|uniref:UspA domain-containing protein n=1 Tax=Physcomitrium patens TaxID=3218 RepID=A0A2K1JIM8_PHYPA|nr:universal stress protein PHOS32-like isoform X1 [Physcomitrium patens]PNR41411.1 hypothetical protein PHYPA_018814 [Physcomitrium patens]|eukprot:XP_024394587.1 universal stress protein PHOS32-like isoform X1 [Physcomitrella patens]
MSEHAVCNWLWPFFEELHNLIHDWHGWKRTYLRAPVLHYVLLMESMPHADAQGRDRKIAIAVDLSDESAYAVKWAVANYLRPGDNVIILHVRPTSVLFGADWGATDQVLEADDKESQQKMEDDFAIFTETKSADLAKPLLDAGIPYKIHIVKDHDMKERICLEVERLGVSAMIMGSRGVGATRRSRKSRLGSVSDYCLYHCECPVIVVRFPEDQNGQTIVHRSNSRPRTPSPHASPSPTPKVPVQTGEEMPV